jgi:hypothetical protein
VLSVLLKWFHCSLGLIFINPKIITNDFIVYAKFKEHLSNFFIIIFV